MSNITKAEQLKSELDALRPFDKAQEAKIMQKLRLDWDYHSNHLEGNSLSYGETKALILFGITAQGKPLKDHFEITGHDEAVKWVMDIVKGEYPLTESFIRELHILLLKEPYEKPAITADGQPTTKKIEVGKYKSTANHVLTKTGEIFRFAEPEHTPALMYDLMDWYNQWNIEDVSPILLAAEFHYKFIRIHPFDDGNGRTARILMNFILMKNGYPPVIIKTEDKKNYYGVLQQADAGIIEPFYEYITENLCRSLELMIRGAKGESIEEPDDLDKEIALLEQKIKNKGKKIEVTRSKEVLLELYDDSVKRLCEKYLETCEKYDKFYFKTGFIVFINGGGSPYEKNLTFEKNRNRIDEDTNRIELRYYYKTFNYSGFDEFDFDNFIILKFNLKSYTVSNFMEVSMIEKLYTEQLSDAEIEELTKFEARRHSIFIEDKIKESEKSKEQLPNIGRGKQK